MNADQDFKAFGQYWHINPKIVNRRSGAPKITKTFLEKKVAGGLTLLSNNWQGSAALYPLCWRCSHLLLRSLFSPPPFNLPSQPNPCISARVLVTVSVYNPAEIRDLVLPSFSSNIYIYPSLSLNSFRSDVPQHLISSPSSLPEK